MMKPVKDSENVRRTQILQSREDSKRHWKTFEEHENTQRTLKHLKHRQQRQQNHYEDKRKHKS